MNWFFNRSILWESGFAFNLTVRNCVPLVIIRLMAWTLIERYFPFISIFSLVWLLKSFQLLFLLYGSRTSEKSMHTKRSSDFYRGFTTNFFAPLFPQEIPLHITHSGAASNFWARAKINHLPLFCNVLMSDSSHGSMCLCIFILFFSSFFFFCALWAIKAWGWG